jgi:ferritin-like metal-binding protein YciE
MKTKSKASANGVKKNKVKTVAKSKASPEEAVGLRKLFIEQVKDIYWAEKALAKAFAKMEEKITSEELQEAIDEHYKETREHAARLEKVFSELGLKPEGKKCEAMAGLINEAEQIIYDSGDSATRDAGIILAVQKIEHYEIATYGTLCTYAKILNEDKILSILKETLSEEKNIDDTLTELAESTINMEAVMEKEW